MKSIVLLISFLVCPLLIAKQDTIKVSLEVHVDNTLISKPTFITKSNESASISVQSEEDDGYEIHILSKKIGDIITTKIKVIKKTYDDQTLLTNSKISVKNHGKATIKISSEDQPFEDLAITMTAELVK